MMWALVPSLRFVLLYSSVFTPVFSSRTLPSTLGTAVLSAVGIDDTCCCELPLWGVSFRISFFACCSHWAIAMRRSSILVFHYHCMSRVGAVSGEERMWTGLLVQCRTVSASGPLAVVPVDLRSVHDHCRDGSAGTGRYAFSPGGCGGPVKDFGDASRWGISTRLLE